MRITQTRKVFSKLLLGCEHFQNRMQMSRSDEGAISFFQIVVDFPELSHCEQALHPAAPVVRNKRHVSRSNNIGNNG